MDQTTQAWLELQCHYIEQTLNGIVLLGPPGIGPFEVMACWPEDKPASSSLTTFSEKLLDSKKKTVSYRFDRNGRYTVISCPIIVGGMCFGVITLMISGGDKKKAKDIGRFLEWGCEWFSWLAKERKHTRAKDGRLVGFVELLALALKHENLEKTAQVIVDSLKRRLGSARVSLGVVKQHHVSVIAISDSQRVEDVPNFIEPIQNAMEEAIDQGATVLLTPYMPGEGLVTHSHRRLLQEHEINAVCTIPMIHNETVVGAIVLENLQGDKIDDTSLHFYEQVAILLGPIIRLKSEDTKPKGLGQSFKHSSWITKALAGLAVFVFICTFFIPGRYEVSADALLDSNKKLVVAASQDGFIGEANVSPGDRVKKGQVLAALDNSDLQLEKRKWLGKRTQYKKAYNSALGNNDRVQINVLKAQLDQANAQIALLDNQLERLILKSPFDGVVTSGDLRKSLGAPTKRGDVLYEVAKLDDYQLQLQVDERDIVDLKVGQTGVVLLSSLPDSPLAFGVEKITPVVTTRYGKSYFQVEAKLKEKMPLISIGMTGIAKVEVASKSLMWIWFHRSYDWISLWLWRL